MSLAAAFLIAFIHRNRRFYRSHREIHSDGSIGDLAHEELTMRLFRSARSITNYNRRATLLDLIKVISLDATKNL